MGKKLASLLFLFAALQSSTQEVKPCQLVVKVENIKKIKGSLKLAIYDQDEEFLKTAINWGGKEIDRHSITYTFDDLKEGIYAVSIFHDENDNGKLDANFMGIPSEPYAFSNNAKGKFGPPSFRDCQVEVKAGVKNITISL